MLKSRLFSLYVSLLLSLDIRVNHYVIHPNFEEAPAYDIAILYTERIEEKSFVPICLTNDDTSLVGHRGSILSYTPTTDEDEYDGILYAALFSIVHRKYCKRVSWNVPKHTFCVNHGQRSRFLCNGDSGSGFMMKNKKRFFLRGLVSTGIIGGKNNDDCTVDDYVVFTDVTKLLSFVTQF